MSDEKAPLRDDHAAAEQKTPEPVSAKSNSTPAVALGFVIIALLGVLIAMVLRGGGLGGTASQEEIKKAEAELNAIRSETNRERMAMGLRPLEGGSEPLEDIADRVKKDSDTLVALAGSYQKILGEKDSELSAKMQEILRSEKLRQTLAAENARLNTELGSALSRSGNTDVLSRELEILKNSYQTLDTQYKEALKKMQNMSAAASTDDLESLQRRLDEAMRAKEFYENRVKELEGSAEQPKLFASSENELLPAAVELFRSLRELENLPDSDVSSAYSGLGVKLGASVMVKLDFATGSSAISQEDQDSITSKMEEVPDGDLVLAIGYASETGNVDNNQKLSSDRATAVASLCSSVKRPSQKTQAVYLGQTDRFGSRVPERNQLVELWHIRKK
ncbi:MAG: OmpA family protein [Akkermansiaceae bacterium]|nr:OmpA family protein [Akkermansiaceae bacterium]